MPITRFWPFVLLFCTSILLAQLPTSTLNGIVTDPNGAVLAGASVTLADTSTGTARKTRTNAEGRYVFSNLAPGSYTLRVEATGFANKELRNINLEVGRASTIDVAMAVAATGETIEVAASATAIQLTESTVQGQIDAQTVEDIPLNGRNFLELAYLIPGNRPGTNFDPTKTNTLEVSSAGAFGRGGNITVDGGDNNDEVVGGTLANFPQDGIQQFQIATNRFTAEVGRSGSSIINIISKSGTNQYHGSGFIFFRHKELQGLPATFTRVNPTTGERVPKPSFDREQVGGSIGGPIIKDRAFWFFALEDRNQDAVVDVGQRDFASRTILGTSAPAPLDDFLLSTHEDFQITEKDKVGFRYSFNKSTDVSNGSLRSPQGSAANRQSSKNRFNSVVGDWTKIFSPTRVNDLIFHYDAFLNEIPAFTNNNPLTNPSGLAAGNELRFPSLQDGANFRIPQRTRFDRYQVRDVFLWNVGTHTLRFGGEFQNIGSDILFDLFGSGTIFTTEDFATQDRNGDGLIDDRDIPVAAVVASAAPSRPPTVPFIRNSYIGFFVQDDWRVTSNLTFNLGLRWDYDNNILGNGDFHRPCPEPLTTAPTERCVWIRTLLGKHDNGAASKNFGPRFGFAWDPFSKGTTVFRGGYGIYYDRVVMEVPLLELLLDGRILPLKSLSGSNLSATGTFLPDPVTGQVVSLANPFGGASEVFGVGINLIANNAAQPYVQQFNLGVQQQLGRNWVVSADGVHNFGQRQLIGRFLRGVTGVPNVSCVGQLPCDVTDPLTGQKQNVTLIASQAKSWYDGLLLSARMNPAKMGNVRWALNVNYTLSKSFNYANDDQIPFNGAEDAVNVQFKTNDLGLEKGYSPTDERHRWVMYGNFEFPGDFSVAPIWTISSGVPMDSRVPALASRLPTIRRNALGRDINNGAELLAAINAYNALPSCSTAPPGPCNNGIVTASPAITPNMHFGDSFNSLDLRLTKGFKITERQRIELIGEGFNVFNITNIRGKNNNNYSGFNNDITSTDFNKAITTAGGFFGSGGPRAFQFALRYTF
jgi:hypothetical protein